jgi:hypothetical protein
MPKRKINAFNLRILLVTVLLAFAFALIIARMIQLSLFSAELYKIESSMSSETKALKSELTDKINQFAAEREAIERSLNTIEQRLMVAEKNELLKEIGDLRLQHQKMVAEVQNLQERVTNLSAVEDKAITRILGAYERTLKKQRKFEFIINFVLGIFSSIIASLLYSLAAEYKLVPRITMRRMFRRMPLIKKLFQNVRAS